MKIAIITTIFPPALGGPAIYSNEIFNRLAKDHEFYVLTYGNYKNSDKIIYIKRRYKNKVLNFFSNINDANKALNKLIKSKNIDVVYAQNPDLAGIPSYLACKKTNKKYIIKFVGDWAWETSYRKGWTKKPLTKFYDSTENLFSLLLKVIQRKILNNASFIVTPAKHLETHLRKAKIKTKIVVVPNAVEKIKVDNIKLKGFNILMVGRLVKHKHFDEIIKLMPKINANLLIIGSGPELGNLILLTKKLNLDGKVRFLRDLDHKKTVSYIYACDVLLLPSIYEGTSHVLLEAMLYKTFIIARNIPGNSELIANKVHGLLFNDINEIPNLIKNIDKRMIENAYKKVAKENTWQQHLNMLTKLF